MADVISESELLGCLADEKSLEMSKKIYDELPVTIISLKLTRNQYYSRLAKMTKVRLVYKSNGEYRVTSLGKVVYGFRQLLQIVLDNQSKLKAIDFLQMQDEIPREELDTIIENLLNGNNNNRNSNKIRKLISKEEGEQEQKSFLNIFTFGRNR